MFSMYAKFAFVFLTLSLMLVLSFGGFIHAVVPHNHGDEHGAAPTTLWNDLHAALGSTQRKMLIAVIGTTFLFLLFSIVRYGEKVFLLARRRQRESIRLLDPIYGELLRRGVMPYRAFR